MAGLGDRLKEERELQKLSKADLARRVGMTGAGIGQIESGVTKAPVPENLYKISDALGLNPRWLISGKEPRHLTAGPASGWMEGFQPNRIAEPNLHPIIQHIIDDHIAGKLSDEDLQAIGDFAEYRKTRSR